MWFSDRSIQSRKFGLEALGVDRLTLGPRGGLINTFRTLDIYALVYLVEGEHEFESGPTGTLPLSAGHLFFLFPGVAHRYGTKAHQRASTYWYVFDGILAGEWQKRGLLNPKTPVFEIGFDKEIIEWFESSIRLAKEEKRENVDLISRHLLNVLQKVFTAGRNLNTLKQAHASVPAVVDAMRSALEQSSFNFSRFCGQNSFSFEYSRKAFQKATGLSPGAYFARLKSDEAKARLVNSTDTVTAIGFSLGFDDPYYFSRWFHKKTGVAPSIFREKYQAFNNRPIKCP